MSATDELLKNNERYAAAFNKGDTPLPPGRGVAVIACMDARLHVSAILGLEVGDAHIFCAREQMMGELISLLDFTLGLLRDFGLTDFYLELSTRPEHKAVGAIEEWEVATNALRQAAEGRNLELVLDEGGGAFYGPKISVQARDAIGRTWQMSTIQVDFQFPQRFDLHFIDDTGAEEQPIMIHRALFGSCLLYTSRCV